MSEQTHSFILQICVSLLQLQAKRIYNILLKTHNSLINDHRYNNHSFKEIFIRVVLSTGCSGYKPEPKWETK